MSEVVVLKAYRANKVLPPGYSVDHDPDILRSTSPRWFSSGLFLYLEHRPDAYTSRSGSRPAAPVAS